MTQQPLVPERIAHLGLPFAMPLVSGRTQHRGARLDRPRRQRVYVVYMQMDSHPGATIG